MRNGEWEPCRGSPTSKTVRVVVIRVSVNEVQLIVGAPAAGKHSQAQYPNDGTKPTLVEGWMVGKNFQ